MSRIDILKQRQARLWEDIAAMLDSFLIGTVAKSPSMTGHGLTTRVEGKTITLYVRKNIVPKALERTENPQHPSQSAADRQKTRRPSKEISPNPPHCRYSNGSSCAL